jgi:hypothetical protein
MAAMNTGVMHLVRRDPGRNHLLSGDSPIGGRFGGFNLEWRSLRELMDPAHELFPVVGLHFVELSAAPNGDEEEEAPAHERELMKERENRSEVTLGFLRNQGVDLQRQANLACRLGRLNRSFEAARYLPDRVMTCRTGSIQAQRDAVYSGVLQLGKNLSGEPRGRGGVIETFMPRRMPYAMSSKRRWR